LAPDMLESQSRALTTRILGQGQINQPFIDKPVLAVGMNFDRNICLHYSR